jgi:hypothetical protein
MLAFVRVRVRVTPIRNARAAVTRAGARSDVLSGRRSTRAAVPRRRGR